MGEPLFVLFGGFLIALPVPLALATNRPHDPQGHVVPLTRRRVTLSAAAMSVALGLYFILVPGLGISDGTGIFSVELGLGLMLFSGVWFIFRQEVVRYQLWASSRLYNLPNPPDAAQVKTAETLGGWIRFLLLLCGLVIILLRVIVR